MTSAVVAWVWIGLTLARLNSAESQRYAQRHLDDQDELYDGQEQLFDSFPGDWTPQGFQVPVWNFLQVSGASDFNQPQYRCSNGTLHLRFSLIRYSDLRLEDGVQLLLLPDRCQSSIQIYRWWLLMMLDTSCYTLMQSGDGIGYSPITLHYFDHLLQKYMTGTAVCENPIMSPQAASPLVTCRTMHVTVKLPRETKLRKVKSLESADFFTNEGYSVRQWKIPNSLFVEISTLAYMDSGFELVYSDPSGKLCTVLALCHPKKVRHHVKRALEEPDLFNMWSFEDIPTEPFDPEVLAPDPDTLVTDTTDTPLGAGAAGVVPGAGTAGGAAGGVAGVVPGAGAAGGAAGVVPGAGAAGGAAGVVPGAGAAGGAAGVVPGADATETEETDAGFYDMWGLEEIPEEPYTGVDVEITTTTAAPAATLATTAAPTTTTTSTAAPITTVTTTTPTTTTVATAAPTTTTTSTPAPITTVTTTAPTTTTVTTTTPTTSTSTAGPTTSTTSTAAPITTVTTTTPTTTTVAAAAPTTTTTSTPAPITTVTTTTPTTMTVTTATPTTTTTTTTTTSTAVPTTTTTSTTVTTTTVEPWRPTPNGLMSLN